MKTNQRNTGAAHEGPATGRFGMRGPLLAPEGDGDGGSTSTSSTPPAETPAPVATSVKTFSQEEVNRIAATAREEGRKAASKPAPAPVSTPAPAVVETNVEKLTKQQLKEQVDLLAGKFQALEQRSAFDKIAAKFEMTEEQAGDYFALSLSNKPTDLKAWIEGKGFKPAAAGSSAAPTAQNATQPQTPADAPRTPPAMAPSSSQPTTPVSPTTQQGLVDLFSLTSEQINQLGPTGMRQHFEAALSVGRQQAGVPQRPTVPARK